MKTELNKLYQENTPSQETAANNIWNTLKTNIQAAAETALGLPKQEKSKPWMTDEILNLIEAKERWSQKQCDEAERLYLLHDFCNFHRKVNEITGV